MKSIAQEHDCLLIDLDGTVFCGRQPTGGAVQSLSQVRSRKLFVTNNASRSADEVAAHLCELGFTATGEDVVTSAQSAAHLLAGQLAPGARVLIVGTEALANEVAAVGLRPVRRFEDRPDAVVQGLSMTTGWSDPIVSRITRTPESRSEELVKKAIEGDALRIGSGDTVKHEEAISPFTAKLFSNITGSQRYVLIAVRHTQPATVDESRKAAIFHHDIRQAGIAMGHDEILAVGHPRLEPGEQFGWREPLMLFVQIILIDKTGFHPSTCSLDAMFRLVVEWAGSRIKRMQPPHCISHDGYLLGRSKVR